MLGHSGGIVAAIRVPTTDFIDTRIRELWGFGVIDDLQETFNECINMIDQPERDDDTLALAYTFYFTPGPRRRLLEEFIKYYEGCFRYDFNTERSVQVYGFRGCDLLTPENPTAGDRFSFKESDDYKDLIELLGPEHGWYFSETSWPSTPKQLYDACREAMKIIEEQVLIVEVDDLRADDDGITVFFRCGRLAPAEDWANRKTITYLKEETDRRPVVDALIEALSSRESMQYPVSSVLEDWGGSDQAAPGGDGLAGAVATRNENGAGRNGPKTKRRRGPSADTLARCREAMKHWLDEDKSLTKASDLAGVARKTVEKWIPKVLGTIDQSTRGEWETKLKALEKFP